MQSVRVAILGASGWMGKTHTMAFQAFPQFLGAADGTARITCLVAADPAAHADLAFRAAGAVPVEADILLPASNSTSPASAVTLGCCGKRTDDAKANAKS